MFLKKKFLRKKIRLCSEEYRLNLHRDISKIHFEGPSVVTIGNFDGVHLGHAALLKKTVELGEKHKTRSVVFTFANHPMEFVQRKKIEYLSLFERKLEIFTLFGISDTVCVPFDERIMDMTTERFSEEILLERLHAKDVVMGFDSRLGKGREGRVEYLKETGERMGFTVHIIEPVLVDEMRVSSSCIRDFIKKGEVESALRYLGRPYELEGEVIHGQKLGRKLGYPTANIRLDYDFVLPKKGVYFCRAILDGKQFDVAVSVGDNPTIENKGFSVEGHLLDFSGDLYGKTLRLQFIRRLRDELKFSSLEDLKEQLGKDTEEIKKCSLLYKKPMIQ